MSCSCCRAISTSERRCASTPFAIADLFERVLILTFGDLERSLGRVERGAGRESALHERLHAIAVEARLARDRLPLAHERRLLGIDRIVVALGGEPQAHARLHQRRLGLADAQLVVSRDQPRDDLALPHDASEVHVHLGDPAGDLEAERHLVLGRERSGHGDGPYQRLFGHNRRAYRPWFRRLVSLRIYALGCGAGSGAKENNGKDEDGRSNAQDTLIVA